MKTIAMFLSANINPDYFAVKILIFYSIKRPNNLRQQSEPSFPIQHVFIHRHKLNLKTD